MTAFPPLESRSCTVSSNEFGLEAAAWSMFCLSSATFADLRKRLPTSLVAWYSDGGCKKGCAFRCCKGGESGTKLSFTLPIGSYGRNLWNQLQEKDDEAAAPCRAWLSAFDLDSWKKGSTIFGGLTAYQGMTSKIDAVHASYQAALFLALLQLFELLPPLGL